MTKAPASVRGPVVIDERESAITSRAAVEIALVNAGARRDRAEEERAEAMREVAELAPQADELGVPRSRIAFLSGVSRSTVHSILPPRVRAGADGDATG